MFVFYIGYIKLIVDLPPCDFFVSQILIPDNNNNVQQIIMNTLKIMQLLYIYYSNMVLVNLN